MKHTKQMIVAGVLLALLFVLRPSATSAQCLVQYVEPIVTGQLGADGWYRGGNVSVTWPPLPDGWTAEEGCETILIDYDTDGTIVLCSGTTDSYGICTFGGGAIIKRDATPPVPVASFSPDLADPLQEGQTIMLDASQSYDETSGVADIAWSVDGVCGVIEGENPPVFTATDGGGINDNTSCSINLSVTDRAGNVAEASYPVVVQNEKPVVDKTIPVPRPDGPVDVKVTFVDAGTADTHNATADWGDGNTASCEVKEAEGAGTVFCSHIYERKGKYEVTVTVEDDNGGAVETKTDIDVPDPEGVMVALKGEWEHPDPNGGYRTFINSVAPLVFTAADPSANGATAEATFKMDPNGPMATISWVVGPSDEPDNTVGVGPALLCITNDEMGTNELDACGNLVIPLKLESQIDGIQTWINATAVNVGLYVQTSNEGGFLSLGDLSFGQGEMTFVTGADQVGRSTIDPEWTALPGEVDASTWEAIQSALDPDGVLPDTPLPAEVAAIYGGVTYRELPGQDIDSSYGQLLWLDLDTQFAVFNGDLDPEAYAPLAHELDKVGKSLRGLLWQNAIHELIRFDEDQSALVEQGLLDDSVGLVWSEQVGDLIDRLGAEPALVEPDPSRACDLWPGGCPETYGSCAAGDGVVEFHVDDDSTAADPDGSASAPFATLNGALARAEELDACGVRLLLEPGVYPEDVTLSRHTLILNQGAGNWVTIEGMVTNTGPYVLEMRGIKLKYRSWNPLAGLFVDHPCARVTLDTVAIEGMHGHGLYQSAGALNASTLFVQNTEVDTWGNPGNEGPGIYLRCGVQASLYDVHLLGNDSGLVIVDEGTRVEASRLIVRDTWAGPFSDMPLELCGEHNYEYLEGALFEFGGLGAVQVLRGAELQADGFLIADNIGYGVLVYMEGRATMENGVIRGTTCLVDSSDPGSPYAYGWGINVGVYNDSRVELSNFVLEGAFHDGAHLPFSGELDLHDGQVRNNVIGVELSGRWDYDLGRLTDNVRYVDNDVNILVCYDPIGCLGPPPGLDDVVED